MCLHTDSHCAAAGAAGRSKHHLNSCIHPMFMCVEERRLGFILGLPILNLCDTSHLEHIFFMHLKVILYFQMGRMKSTYLRVVIVDEGKKVEDSPLLWSSLAPDPPQQQQ